ncbi:MAG: malto-oligosyltrehalose trehalohydrolase [Chitinophagaceae bacterium]|nr:malto-oligosyltrehalose trehalohydrolase [Chitinophagaceae bacterium]
MMRVNTTKRNIGVNFDINGKAIVTVWSPRARNIELETCKHGSGKKRLSLTKDPQKGYLGYWTCTTDSIKPGDKYRFVIDEAGSSPDPASLSQPDDVHGPSAAFDVNSFGWTDANWKNIPLEQYIMYELHTGTFSSEHNFEGIEKKLDHLIELGINAIEVMPVGQFPGSRNWGYDGVYPFAVQHSYGGPAALQKLVNTCHQKGLAVILDVIYNHVGPEGNYLSFFGPYFTDKYLTPWGKAINYDDKWCDGVREYFIENTLMWFRDFHIDALRLDAVHAIKDFSAFHIIKEIKQHTDELMRLTSRNYYLITEMDLNDPIYINPIDKGGYGVDAQWIDEFHHALRVAAGQPKEGYYEDFNGIEDISKSYKDAYVYTGQFSGHRKRLFGTPTYNPGKQFIVFSQNHDQVGNRMLGERSGTLTSANMYKLMAAAVVVSPYIPMLFMGEEWKETNPFLFFISHTDNKLAAIVSEGRKKEFASFKWINDPPDPRLEETFNNSLLQWKLLDVKEHKDMFLYYKQLISLRKSNPALKNLNRENTIAEIIKENNLLVLHRWHEGQYLFCIMNFSSNRCLVKSQLIGNLLLNSADEYKEGFIEPESILIYERH